MIIWEKSNDKKRKKKKLLKNDLRVSKHKASNLYAFDELLSN